ncbi:hypothetical protein MHK_000301, partial [Candidatus Magnetomorum sp. HK-1]
MNNNLLTLAKYFSILIIAVGITFFLHSIISLVRYERLEGEIIDFKKSTSTNNSSSRSGYGYKNVFLHPVVKFIYNEKNIQATAINGFSFGKYVR